MSRARVSWVEISLGEFIAFSAAAGTALAVSHASGRTILTSSDRLATVVAVARGVTVQALPRGAFNQAASRSGVMLPSSRDQSPLAEERLEWAP